MRKICFILPTTELGGGPKHLHDLLKRLDFKKWEPFICTQKDGPYWDEFKKLNIRIFPFALRKVSLTTPFKLMSLLRKEKPDLIHTHGSRAGIYGRLVARLLGIPVIHTYHGFRFDHLSPFLRLIYILAENILSIITTHHICVGEGEKQRTSILKLTSGQKFSIIHNGIDFESIQNMTVERNKTLVSLGLDHFLGHTIIGTIARVAPEKDLITLLAGFSLALKKNPDIRLIIIGGCPKGHEIYQREVENYVSSNNLEKFVALLGDRQDAVKILKCMDAYVSSSLTEGLPLSLLEAFAAGVPIVATDIPGHKDVVRNSVFGLLLSKNSAQGLSRGILKMLSLRPEERKILSRNGIDRIKNKFSLEAMAKNTVSLYETILGSR